MASHDWCCLYAFVQYDSNNGDSATTPVMSHLPIVSAAVPRKNLRLRRGTWPRFGDGCGRDWRQLVGYSWRSPLKVVVEDTAELLEMDGASRAFGIHAGHSKSGAHVILLCRYERAVFAAQHRAVSIGVKPVADPVRCLASLCGDRCCRGGCNAG